VFTPSCNPASGTASAALTSQDGDLNATASAPFTVSNCTAPPPPPPVAGLPQLGSVSLHALARHRFELRLSVAAGSNAPGLKSVQVALPAGLRFARVHGHKLQLRELVSTRGARIASVKLVGRRLVISLRIAARRVTVAIKGLSIPIAGHATRRHHRKRLRVVVSVTDSAGKSTRFHARTLDVRV
jgi:hypothetical protein